MEVRYDDAPRQTVTRQPVRTELASISHQLMQERTRTPNQTDHQSLFGDGDDREHMLLSALAHATKQHEAAEQAMHLSETRYRRLFEAFKDSIIIFDAHDLSVRDLNQAAERLISRSRHQARGQRLSNLRPFADIPDFDSLLQQIADQQITHQEITVPDHDNTLQNLDIVASCYIEENREIVQLSIRDITDRKKTAKLEVECQELLAVNSAKDEFISVASHQLRTPATAVKQYLGLLLQGYIGRLTRDQRHTLERAYDSNERQLKIINDLLLVARVDAGKVTLYKEPTDLTRMIRDIVAEQQAVLERRKQPIALALPRTLKTFVDPRFMRMVIENLLSNASKYSPSGQPITIQGRRERRNAVIDIVDQGYGISATDQSKLYQKFSRIYNERATSIEGTGLGLYWSKKIIELHRGSLTLESAIDKGSTFTISLPAR